MFEFLDSLDQDAVIKVIGLGGAGNEVRKQLEDAKQILGMRELTIKDLQDRLFQLGNDHTELKTTLQRREEHYQEQMSLIVEAIDETPAMGGAEITELLPTT